ncbi:MAG: hypothetical protein HY537_08915 [Deltaproteobacteria bacterium]|nr:hypothetical protein [Deltaproteobacteria bacterium]
MKRLLVVLALVAGATLFAQWPCGGGYVGGGYGGYGGYGPYVPYGGGYGCGYGGYGGGYGGYYPSYPGYNREYTRYERYERYENERESFYPGAGYFPPVVYGGGPVGYGGGPALYPAYPNPWVSVEVYPRRRRPFVGVYGYGGYGY